MKTTILKEGKWFRLLMRRTARGRRTGEKRFYIECTCQNCLPRGRRISASDTRYLESCNHSFDFACVMDFGVGVFQQ